MEYIVDADYSKIVCNTKPSEYCNSKDCTVRCINLGSNAFGYCARQCQFKQFN